MLERISKLTINETLVEESSHDWREILVRQLPIPLGTAALVGVIIATGEWPPQAIVILLALVGYGTLPALGSAYYLEEERDQDV